MAQEQKFLDAMKDIFVGAPVERPSGKTRRKTVEGLDLFYKEGAGNGE